ncbi:MAG: DEAD/DEAH box helicase family protein [Candidatus Dormibacteraeota bacterium]|nr:DEAD/DEAH box helicase family protein [Candidatus Dormibacteraeota bacterium]
MSASIVPLSGGYVAFDLEATGLSPKSDRVIEIGAVKYDSGLRPIGELQLLVDPGMPIPLAVQRLVGFGPEDVRGAPSPVEAMAQLAEFCDGAALVTHGGAFDMHFASTLAPDAFGGRAYFDTLELARILLPLAEAHGLPQLALALGLHHERPHRALSDAEATGALFALLVDVAAGLPRHVLREMQRVVGPAGGSLRAFFDEVVSSAAVSNRHPAAGDSPTKAQSGASQIGAANAIDATWRAVSPASGSTLAGLSLEAATVAALSHDGPLAAGDGFEVRDAQVQMARAVAQALDRSRRLMVEAGTGVGKSLAYLVPLVLWAARHEDRAVVATHTVNLQEQLADRDLPAIANLTEPPVPVALLKGRGHYISLRRWARFLAEPDVSGRNVDLDAIRFKLKLLVWLTRTSTGDRAELRLAAEEEPLWARVASDREDCLGPACANWVSRRCHMVAARHRANEAAIVVTNHALLLADSERQGQVLAPYSVLVVDEAHQLEASATQQLGHSLRAFDVLLVLDRIPASSGSSLAQSLLRGREATQRVFGDAKGLIAEMEGMEHAGNARIGLSASVREDPRFTTLLKSGRHAVSVLLDIARELETESSRAVQAELLPQPARVDDEVELAAVALRELATSIDRVLCNPCEGFVSWLELRAEQSQLHEAPISVAEPLRQLVYDRCDSVTLTSATLTVAGSFDFVRQRVGIGNGAEELALESPFDYLRNALCVLTDGVPPYDDPRHDEVIAGLVGGVAERLEGRTLVLFTGYGPLRRVHAMLHERLQRLGIALLGQGLDGTRRQILRSFLDDPRTVLLGTSSFWEGVDIPGERLRCIVIDKLPFAVPTDPLVRARTEGMRDPFAQYVLPAAVIRLRQGFGRLIRGHADRGAVVLCDERLSVRDYGDVFLRALPPAAQVRAVTADVPDLVTRFALTGSGVH